MKISAAAFWKFSTLIACIFLTSCNEHTGLLSEKELTHLYFDSLSAHYPKVKFEISDDSSITARKDSNDIFISSDNLYRAYQQSPESVSVILGRYVFNLAEIFHLKKGPDITRIVPVIKPKEYLNFLKETHLKEGSSKKDQKTKNILYNVRYNDQLIITYAEDLEKGVRYLSDEEIQQLHIEKDSLKTIAIRNLENIITVTNRKGEGFQFLTAGGTYELSIILLKRVWKKENIAVDGDFIIAIPNRDLLFVVGSNDKQGISKIKEIAQSSFETEQYPISKDLFKWNGDTFEKFD
jgi:hypothetical protein